MSELRVGFVGLGAMGEPGIDARCVEAHLAPASDQPWMAGPAHLTRDGSQVCESGYPEQAR